MIKRRTKNESFETLNKVVSDKDPSATSVIDTTTAAALIDHAESEKKKEEVQAELQKGAEGIKPTELEEPEVAVENDFTAKLVLDESLNDFSIDEAAPIETKKDGRSNKVFEKTDEDEYLDYDMFDFVYGIVAGCWPKPKHPFGKKRYKTFMYIGSDTYSNAERIESGNVTSGHAQVASFGDVIQVYHNDTSYFDDVAEFLDVYKIKYSGPEERRNKNTYWKYAWTIYVPCVDSGYPYMLEDYLDEIGVQMEDVMDNNFCTQYRSRKAKMEKENQKYLNDAEVEKLINKAIVAAARDNTEPLDAHVKRLYVTLTDAGLKYQKAKVKKTFMDAFDDGDDEDDE